MLLEVAKYSTRYALLALAFVLLAACTEDRKGQIERAEVLLAANDIPGAILEFKSAIQSNPLEPKIRVSLAHIYLRIDDAKSAEKELRKALELDYTPKARATEKLAKALFLQRKNDELLLTIPEDIEGAPDSVASIYAWRGRAFVSIGNEKKALESLAKAQTLDPDNTDALMLEARIQLGSSNITAALEIIDKLLGKDPKHKYGLLLKAELLRAMDEADKALGVYTQLIAVDSSHFQGLARRSNLLLSESRLQEAENDIATLERFHPGNPLTKISRGMLDLARGNAKSALKSAQDALKIDVQSDGAQLLAGLAHKSLGSLGQAEHFLSAVVSNRSYNLFARHQLAETRLLTQQFDAAAGALLPIIDAGILDAGTFNLMGLIARARGDLSEAFQWFDKAALANPSGVAAAAFKALSSTSQDSARSEGAFHSLESIIKSQMIATVADEVLITNNVRHGKVNKARELVDDLMKRAPDSPITVNLHGIVLMAENKREAAKDEFLRTLSIEPNFLPAVTNLVQLDIAAGNPDDAIQRYQNIIDSNEKNVEATLAFADFVYRLGDRKHAIRLLEKIVLLYPSLREPTINLCKLLLADGNYAQALVVAEKGLEENSKDPQMIMTAARAALAANENKRANRIIQLLLGVSNVTPTTYVEISEIQFLAGFVDSALTSLDDGLRASPRSADLHIAKVSLLTDLRRFLEAQEYAESVQQAQPDAPIGYLLEGEIFQMREMPARAVESFKEALKRQQIGAIAVKLFDAERAAFGVSPAMKNLAAWLKNHPNEHAARHRLAEAYSSEEDFGKAAAQYEKLAHKGILTVNLLNNLAWAYFKLGDDRALATAERAYVAQPKSGTVLDTFGWLLFSKGELDRALPALRQAALLLPDNQEIKYHLAAALAKSNEPEKAKILLSEVLSKTNNMPIVQSEAQQLFDSLN